MLAVQLSSQPPPSHNSLRPIIGMSVLQSATTCQAALDSGTRVESMAKGPERATS